MSRPQAPNGLLRDAALGALAGVAGTYAISQVTPFLKKLQPQADRDREKALSPKASTTKLAERIDRLAGLGLSARRREKLATAIHWGYGMAWGALYGVLHDRVPALSRRFGLAYATFFFVVGDEGIPTLFKLVPPPQHFPLSMHLRDLAGHVTYTVATDAAFHGGRALGRWGDRASV